MGMSGTSVVLEPGQAIHVPTGAVHNAAVVGETPVVCLDAIKE
jgi:mannose-6-phosphate isomerase-like protein (cupin superfamily)